ncbi:hypothetical protein AB0M35_23210 [Micromonospora sp. NPDC051196]
MIASSVRWELALNSGKLTAKEEGMARLVLAAAVEARELSGYLFFEGD